MACHRVGYRGAKPRYLTQRLWVVYLNILDDYLRRVRNYRYKVTSERARAQKKNFWKKSLRVWRGRLVLIVRRNDPHKDIGGSQTMIQKPISQR